MSLFAHIAPSCLIRKVSEEQVFGEITSKAQQKQAKTKDERKDDASGRTNNSEQQVKDRRKQEEILKTSGPPGQAESL